MAGNKHASLTHSGEPTQTVPAVQDGAAPAPAWQSATSMIHAYEDCEAEIRLGAEASTIDTGQVRQRERWFIEGAAALRRTLTANGMQDMLPSTGQYYACPLCLMTYGRDAFDKGCFTGEHVPPRHAGGRVLALTCERCNSTAGSSMDADAEGREAVLDFFGGLPTGRGLRAEFAVGDLRIRGNISSTGDAMLLSVVPKANNPSEVAELRQALEVMAAEGISGRIGFRFIEHVSPTRARLSWVRAAYLAAFAAFGWRCVLMSYLNPVRAQLANPTASILPPLALRAPEAPRERRELLIVQQPEELRSIAVVLGRYTVFLPSFVNPQPVDALAAGLAQYFALPSPRPPYVGKQVPWPTEPQYALDRPDDAKLQA